MAVLSKLCRVWPWFAAAALIAGDGGQGSRRPTAAATKIATTEQVYAAFTVNLTQFVTWPETAFRDDSTPLTIGTFPRDPINPALDAAAANERSGGRPIRTVRLQSLDDIPRCHVIFISKSNPRQAAALERASGRPILTIGDADGFLELGGHVRFVPQPPHTRLCISVENLKACGLMGRAQLLRIAAQ